MGEVDINGDKVRRKYELTASITGPPFFFCVVLLDEKKDPKKLASSFLRSTSRSLLLLICPGASLPDLGSGAGGGGLFAFMRSLMTAIAWVTQRTLTNVSNYLRQYGTYLVAVEEVWVGGIYTAGLHSSRFSHEHKQDNEV
jgi:hypothetical protein